MTTFSELGVSPDLSSRLRQLEIQLPTNVQIESLPALIAGRDLLVQAPTGSGKTLAFLLPAIERARAGRGLGTRVLVLTPTRELAMQVESVFTSLESGIPCALLYGGVGYFSQERQLAAGATVVVGTPGRVLDLVERRKLSLARIEYLVLDEADEMLDIGFAPQVEKIMGLTWHPQTVLASATMPDWVRKVVRSEMHEPVEVRVEDLAEDTTLEHARVVVDQRQRVDSLIGLLRAVDAPTIVFGRTKQGVANLCRELNRRRVRCSQLQGDMRQVERDRVMKAFRAGQTRVLIATNVAARGLDVSQVDLVVNYELPDSPDALTHRIGRTARAGRKGRAVTITSHHDAERWRRLRAQGAPELPELDAQSLITGRWEYAGERRAEILQPSAPAKAAREGAPPRTRRRRRRSASGRSGYLLPIAVDDAPAVEVVGG